MILTISVDITKKSAVNKVRKTVFKCQEFKNLLYLCLHEYYNETKDLSPFLNLKFLNRFVKGKEYLKCKSAKINEYQNQLITLWKEYLGSDTIAPILREFVREVKGCLGKWKRKQKSNLPKPKKLNSLKHYTLNTKHTMLIDKRKLKRKQENSIVIRLSKKYGSIKVKIPKSINIRGIRIKWFSFGLVKVLISYEVKESNLNLNEDNWLGIDVGVNNLVSCVSNVGNSFIISGNELKAFNQWINKTSAKLQSNNEEIKHKKLWYYRTKILNQFFGFVANIVIRYCIDHNIGTIIIPNSLNKEYSRKSNKGKRFNQTFRFIPLGKLIGLIEQKAKLVGIEVIKTDERYTSKCSSLTEKIENIKSSKDCKNGKRVKRGLFKDHVANKIVNADLNGALNIVFRVLKDKARNQFFSCNKWISKLCNPIKLYLFRKQVSHESIARWIVGSNSYHHNGGSDGHQDRICYTVL